LSADVGGGGEFVHLPLSQLKIRKERNLYEILVPKFKIFLKIFLHPESHHQNAGKNHEIKTDNRSLKYAAQFRYLGTTVANQKEEIKRRLNCSNACSHSVQNLMSSYLLSKNLKVAMYMTIILPVAFVWV
jgi:hypothetical protein